MSKIIINFAPTGMIPTKEMTPHVPVSVKEIIEDVHRAVEIGITMVHLHARDPMSGEPTYRAEIYEKIINGIRRFAPDLIVCVSLSGRTFSEFEKRAAPLQLEGKSKPDMGSLTLSSVNFNNIASISSPDMIKALALEMKEKAILPELEVFDVGMINYARYLEQKDLLTAPHYFNILCGNIACAQADLLHIGVMIRDLPPDSAWSLGGIGNWQLMVNATSIAVGGGVRVGLEDNIWYDPQRTRLATNADLLSRIHGLIASMEYEIMTSAELRRLLQLESGKGKYGRKILKMDANISGSTELEN